MISGQRQEYGRNYRKANRDTLREKDRARYNAWRESLSADELARAHHSQVLKKYNLSQVEYERILASQGGVCACCGKPEATISRRRQSPMRLTVDHDHLTGVVRGLLCRACNLGIGQLGDSLEGVKKAVTYLERRHER